MWNGHKDIFRREANSCYINRNLTLSHYCLLEENFTMLYICPLLWVELCPSKRYVVTLTTCEYDIIPSKVFADVVRWRWGCAWLGWALNPMPLRRRGHKHRHKEKATWWRRQRWAWWSCKASTADPTGSQEEARKAFSWEHSEWKHGPVNTLDSESERRTVRD